MATNRPRVTVNLLDVDADWLRAQAETFNVSLSIALQTLVAAARVDQERQAVKQQKAETKRLRRERSQWIAACLQFEFNYCFPDTYRDPKEKVH